ncbi:unnamed protein product, partial [Mycena citricolor]
ESLWERTTMTEPEQPDILNPATFVPPQLAEFASITIEFCDRCRWLHRAAWVQTELLLTFAPPVIGSITLVPRNSEETAGRFRVWVGTPGSAAPQLAWDRKVEGGFPELKILVCIARLIPAGCTDAWA